MPYDVDSAFQHCVSLLRRGVTLDDCLSRYPGHADELQPMLIALTDVHSIPSLALPSEARGRIRNQILAEWDNRYPSPKPHKSYLSVFPRWAAVAAAVVLALVFSGAGVVIASEAAVPGAALYPIKQLQEETRLWLARSPEAKTNIYTSLVRERVEEIMALAETDSGNSMVIAVDRLERHIYDADRLSRESSQTDQGTGLGMSIAVFDALDSATAQYQSISITIEENISQSPAKMYPCLQYTFEAIRQGRDRVRAAVEAIGRSLPEASSERVIPDTNLCPP